MRLTRYFSSIPVLFPILLASLLPGAFNEVHAQTIRNAPATSYNMESVCDFIEARLYTAQEAIDQNPNIRVVRLESGKPGVDLYKYSTGEMEATVAVMKSRKFISSVMFNSGLLSPNDRNKASLLHRLGANVSIGNSDLTFGCDAMSLTIKATGTTVNAVKVSSNSID